MIRRSSISSYTFVDCPVLTPVILIPHVETIFYGIYLGLKKKKNLQRKIYNCKLKRTVLFE